MNQNIVHCTYYTLYIIHCTLFYTVHCTLYIVHCYTLYTVHCTLYIVKCMLLYIVLRTMYIMYSVHYIIMYDVRMLGDWGMGMHFFVYFVHSYNAHFGSSLSWGVKSDT